MNKKIIAIAILFLCLVVVFVACKKDDGYKVGFTVTLENGDTVEVFENEDGENFVTNVDGDEIPVTSDEDGFYDSIEDLITETTTKKADKTTEADKSGTTSTNDKDKDEDKRPSSNNDKEKPSSNDNSKEESSSEGVSIEIGSETGTKDTIAWEDIVTRP